MQEIEIAYLLKPRPRRALEWIECMKSERYSHIAWMKRKEEKSSGKKVEKLGVGGEGPSFDLSNFRPSSFTCTFIITFGNSPRFIPWIELTILIIILQNSISSTMSFLFGGQPKMSSEQKLAAAETEVEMIADMFNR